MGAFNILIGKADCPSCGHRVPFKVQFKYGDTWQYSYVLGEKIKWGGNDVGKPGYPKVKVEGIGGPCPDCGVEDIEFDIILEYDIFKTLTAVGLTRQTESKEGYTVEQTT